MQSVISLGNRAVRQRSELLFIAVSFWVEESPCAVRTNTAILDRLCTLCYTVYSALVVAETCGLYVILWIFITKHMPVYEIGSYHLGEHLPKMATGYKTATPPF